MSNTAATLSLKVNTNEASQSLSELKVQFADLLSALKQGAAVPKISRVVDPSATSEVVELKKQTESLKNSATEIDGVGQRMVRVGRTIQTEMNSVSISVKSGISNIGDALKKVNTAASEATQALEAAGQKTSTTLARQVAERQMHLDLIKRQNAAEAAEGRNYLTDARNMLASHYAQQKAEDRAYLASAKAALQQHYASNKADLAKAIAERAMQLDMARQAEDRQTRLQQNSLLNNKWNYTYGGDQLAQLRNQVRIAQEIEKAMGALPNRTIVSNFGSDAFQAINSGATSVASLRSQIEALTTANVSNARTHAGSTSTLRSHTDAVKEHREQQAMLHSTLRGVAGGMDNLWLTYGRYVGHMIAAYTTVSTIRKSMESGVEFDYQTRFVATLGDDRNPQAYKSIQENLYSIKDAPADVNELARSLRVLQQTGIDAAQGYKLLDTVIAASVLGETNMKTAAEDIVGVLEVFNLHSKDPLTMEQNFRKVGDVMAYVAQETKANLHDVASSMQAASGVAEQYGISLNFAAGVVASLGKQGITGSKAGTYTRNFIEELYQPKTAKSEKAYKELGIKAYDEQGNARDAMDLTKELATKLSKYSEQGQASFIADMFDERGKKAIRSIIDNLKEFEDQVKGAEQSVGLLSDQFKRLEDSTQVQLNKLKADANNLLTKAFDDTSLVAPIQKLRDLLADGSLQQLLTSLVRGVIELGTFAAEHAEAIVNFGKALAVWGSVQLASGIGTVFSGIAATVASTLLPALSSASIGVQSFAAITAGTATTLSGGTGLVAALGPLAAAIGPITLAITAAGTAWYLFRDRTSEALEESSKRIKDFVVDVKSMQGKIDELSTSGARAVASKAVEVENSKYQELRKTQKDLANRYGLDVSDLSGSFDVAEVLKKTGGSRFLASTRENIAALRQANDEFKQLAGETQKLLDVANAKANADFKVGENAIASGNLGNEAGTKVRPPKPDKDALRAAREQYLADLQTDKNPIALAAEKFKQDVDALKIQMDEGLLTYEEYWSKWRESAKQKNALTLQAQTNDLRDAQKNKDKVKIAKFAGDIAKTQENNNTVDAEADKGLSKDLTAASRKFENQYLKEQLQLVKETSKAELDWKRSLMTESEKEISIIRENANERYLAGVVALMSEKEFKASTIEVQQALMQQQLELRNTTIEALEAEKQKRDELNNSWETGAVRALNKYSDAANKMANTVEKGITGILDAMDSSLRNFVKTGKFSITDFKNAVINALIDIQIQTLKTNVLKPILGMSTSWLGGLFSSTTPSGLDAKSTGAYTSGGVYVDVAHTGALIGEESPSQRSVPLSVFSGAARYHTGGIASDEVPTILQKGEGVFTAGQMRALGAGLSGSGTNVNVNVINQAGSDVQVQPNVKKNSDGGIDVEMIVRKVVIGDLSSNGQMSQAIAGKFGLSNRAY